jgi:hypothetical protein
MKMTIVLKVMKQVNHKYKIALILILEGRRKMKKQKMNKKSLNNLEIKQTKNKLTKIDL